MATTPSTGLTSLFKKPATAAANGASGPEVPQVPVGRVVSSPRRTVGKGRRDTILTGADGLQ
jgi:hypothetical protein